MSTLAQNIDIQLIHSTVLLIKSVGDISRDNEHSTDPKEESITQSTGGSQEGNNNMHRMEPFTFISQRGKSIDWNLISNEYSHCSLFCNLCFPMYQSYCTSSNAFRTIVLFWPYLVKAYSYVVIVILNSKKLPSRHQLRKVSC